MVGPLLGRQAEIQFDDTNGGHKRHCALGPKEIFHFHVIGFPTSQNDGAVRQRQASMLDQI